MSGELTTAAEVNDLISSRDPVIETMRKAGLDYGSTLTLAYALIADRKDRAVPADQTDGAGLREAVRRIERWISNGMPDTSDHTPHSDGLKSDLRTLLSALTGNPSLHVSENIGLLAQGLVPIARAGDVSGQTEAGE